MYDEGMNILINVVYFNIALAICYLFTMLPVLTVDDDVHVNMCIRQETSWPEMKEDGHCATRVVVYSLENWDFVETSNPCLRAQDVAKTG